MPSSVLPSRRLRDAVEEVDLRVLRSALEQLLRQLRRRDRGDWPACSRSANSTIASLLLGSAFSDGFEPRNRVIQRLGRRRRRGRGAAGDGLGRRLRRCAPAGCDIPAASTAIAPAANRSGQTEDGSRAALSGCYAWTAFASRTSLVSSGTMANASPTTSRSAKSRDRDAGIFVDGDDRRRGTHAHLVLDGSGDADRDVERRADRLPGLSDLVAVRDPAGVDGRARGADRAAERFGEIVQNARERLGTAHAATAGNDDRGLLDAELGGRFLNVVLDGHHVRLAARRKRHDLAGARRGASPRRRSAGSPPRRTPCS